MKRLILCLLALTAGTAMAQTPPMMMGEPETVYSSAQREKDQQTSRHVVETMLAPSFSVEDQYARWKKPICPHVYGLTPVANFFIEHRIKEVAQKIGAPVDLRDSCVANIGIVFTANPQATLDSIATAKLELVLGGRRDLKVTQPVQAWYVAFKTDYHGMETMDLPWQDMDDQAPIPTNGDPRQAGISSLDAPKVAANVSRLHTGLTSSLGTATVLVDSSKVQGLTLGTLGDYLAVLSLTQSRSNGECLDRPSILNLMAAGCDPANRAMALDDVDIALMTALYSVPDYPERLQKQRIIGAMRRSLEAQFGRN
jgi:hypothetical protein